MAESSDFKRYRNLSKFLPMYLLQGTRNELEFVFNGLKMRADMVYLCYLGPTEHVTSNRCKTLLLQNRWITDGILSRSQVLIGPELRLIEVEVFIGLDHKQNYLCFSSPSFFEGV